MSIEDGDHVFVYESMLPMHRVLQLRVRGSVILQTCVELKEAGKTSIRSDTEEHSASSI